MYFKLGLISGLVAAAASLPSTSFYETSGNYNPLTSYGKHYVTYYTQVNAEETCFSVRPVVACDDKHVSTQIKHQKVGFHCLDSNLSITKQMKRDVQNGKRLSLENKSQDVQAYVEVPINCETINSDQEVARKAYENNYEQKVHVIDPDDDQENICTNSNEYNYNSESNQNSHENHESSNWSSFKDSLVRKYNSIEEIVTLSPIEYNNVFQDLKSIIQKHKQSFSTINWQNFWTSQMETNLPSSFGTVAKQFYDYVIYDSNDSQSRNEELYRQYTELVKRVYVYVVKHVLQQLNYDSGNVQNHQQWNNVAIRNLWSKVQRQLTKNEILQIMSIVRYYENKKQDAKQDLMWDLTNYHKNLRQHFSKIIVSSFILAKKQSSESSETYHENSSPSYYDLFNRFDQKLENIKNYF